MKNCRAFLLVISGLAIFLPVAAAQDPPLEVAVRRLSDRVLIVNVPGPQSTNVVALQTARGIVVVDTEVSPQFAAAIRRRIEIEFGTDHFYAVVNTHGHGDHTYGNQEFGDALIVAHESVASTMAAGEERRHATATRLAAVVANLSGRLQTLEPDSAAAAALRDKIAYYDAMGRGLGEGFQLTLPSVGFTSRLEMDLGDLTLEMSWFGKSHSDGDILIFCPEEGLLLTGDLFAPGVDLYVDSERITHFPRWIESLEAIVERLDQLTTIVPGHGDPLPAEEFETRLAWVRQQEDVFEGRESAFLEARAVFDSQGAEAFCRALREFHGRPERYYLLHPEADSFAFRLMMDEDLENALMIFSVLAELFPENDVAFDSLGEIRMRMDEAGLAVESFQRALQLNPDNRNARARLDQLTSD